MKRKHLFLAIAALLAAGGLWLARSAWRSDHSAFHNSNTAGGLEMPSDRPQPGKMLQPPNPNRRFQELTPEERVKLARKGPIGG